MTESEFNQLTDKLFLSIEEKTSEYDLDIQNEGNILIIENDEGEQIYINKHLSNQEIWVSANRKAYHFEYQNGLWTDTKEGQNFFDLIDFLIKKL